MQSETYRDFDAFSHSVVGIDATMMLQNPKHRVWTINHVKLPEIDVQLGRLGSGNIVEGESWSDRYMIYLPLTDECEYLANGTVVDRGSFAILEPGCDFCVSTKFEHDWCNILVPASRFARSDDLEQPWAGPEKRCRATCTDRGIARQFRNLVNQTMTAASHCSQFKSQRAATFVETELLKVASLVVGQRLADQHHREGRPRVPRQEIIRRCNQLLEKRECEPVRLEQLTVAADVSERTLRSAFNEYYGVGPVRYLQLRRLHQVRRALRAADPQAVSVSKVLVEHGEWEFGHFAARYRRLFGEFPSETLRAKGR